MLMQGLSNKTPNLRELPDSESRGLDGLLSDAGHLRVLAKVEGQKGGHSAVSGSLDVLDEDIVDLSYVRRHKSNISHSKRFKTPQSCSQRCSLVRILL